MGDPARNAARRRPSSALRRLIPAALLLLAAGCSTEQTAFTLGVTAAPNPVTGQTVGGVRRWDYTIAIANPTPTAITVEGYFYEIADTDTGFTRTLRLVTDSTAAGVTIPAGGSWSYAANDEWETFSTGNARRIYKALGDDGVYYTGEVVMQLR